jgi:hypothetical protein
MKLVRGFNSSEAEGVLRGGGGGNGEAPRPPVDEFSADFKGDVGPCGRGFQQRVCGAPSQRGLRPYLAGVDMSARMASRSSSCSTSSSRISRMM